MERADPADRRALRSRSATMIGLMKGVASPTGHHARVDCRRDVGGRLERLLPGPVHVGGPGDRAGVTTGRVGIFHALHVLRASRGWGGRERATDEEDEIPK